MNRKQKAAELTNQGAKILAEGNTKKAIQLFNKSINLYPKIPATYFNLGLAYQQTGNAKAAIKAFKNTLKLSPNDYEAYNNLGNYYVNQGKTDLAIIDFKKAVAINPMLSEGFYNLGVCYKAQGKPEKAIDSYKTSLKIYKNYTNALNNIAMIYEELGQRYESLKYLQKALKISPDNPMVLLNLGAAFITSNTNLARKYFERAVFADTDNAMANYNLGVALRLLGQNIKSIGYFKKALEIDPLFTTVYKELYLQTRDICDWNETKKIEQKVKKLTDNALKNKSLPDETPFASMLKDESPKRNYEVAKAWSKYIKDKVSLYSKPYIFGKKHPARSQGKIRIGYLSCDFKNHATAHLMVGLFRLHDRTKFEIYIYSYGEDDKSSYRKEIKKTADCFRDIINLSDLEAANLIYKDKIDILVDLKGHTGGSRFEIAALRSAPIQVNYLGFPGTSGADFIDYFITDKVITPAKDIPFYSEKLIFLPHSYQVNDNKQSVSTKVYTRADFGLPVSPSQGGPATRNRRRSVVFCSFNMPYKITPKIFDSWMRILNKVPKSVLWLLEKNGQDTKNLKQEAKKRGVNPTRLIFTKGIRKDEHLSRLTLADLGLDTFTCNGMTTTSDALWAGVPVITLKGNHFASRVSTSLLTAVGLPELITHSPKQYENLAIHLATNPEKLYAIRSTLNANKLTSPLFDTARFTKYLEEAYQIMWKNYLTGKKPTNIIIKP